MVLMKRILYIMAIIMLAVTSCKEQDPVKTPAELICGDWHSTMLAVEGDIYASFASDGSFDLYQKIGEGAYRLYTGSWTMNGNVISGKYSDGSDWSSSYSVIFNDKFMTWTSQNDASEESQYQRCPEIPAEVIENSHPQ
jgi:hypothetical protein